MPYLSRWLHKHTLRASAILTGSAVNTSQHDIRDCNQIILYVNFTIGSLTYGQMVVEFSSDGTTWYQEGSYVSGGSGVRTRNQVAHRFTASGRHRIPIPVADYYVRVACLGNGTATDSLMAVELQAGSSA